jgi:hypothetical protein
MLYLFVLHEKTLPAYIGVLYDRHLCKPVIIDNLGRREVEARNGAILFFC